MIIATTNIFSNFDKALSRRFDAVINFDCYSKEDLIRVAGYYFSLYIKKFAGFSQDRKLFKKILSVANELPYPGDLKNIIKTSLAFSSVNNEYDYLQRLYNSLVGNLEQISIDDLKIQGFTAKEIMVLKGE